MAEIEPAVYKAAEAAKLLKCTRAALLKECREGRWGAFKVGRDWRIPKRSFDFTLSGGQTPENKKEVSR